MFKFKSKLAIIVLSVIILLTLLLFIQTLFCEPDESLCGFFLGIFVLPWIIGYLTLLPEFLFESLIFSMLIYFYFYIINLLIIYYLCYLFEKRFLKAKEEDDFEESEQLEKEEE